MPPSRFRAPTRDRRLSARTLKTLNDATIAWLERDYHRREHREIGMTPHRRLAESVDASRPCPGTDVLRDAFRIAARRTVRRSTSGLPP